MSKIIMVDKKQLSEIKLNFLTCPSLAIPVLEKTYYSKFFWFRDMNEVFAKLSKVKPLIILDAADKIPTFDKIPPEFRNLENVYCVRMWDSIPEKDWIVIRSNICETDNHNFTFKWGTEYFTDPIITAAMRKKEIAENQAKEYDKKELEEFMENHKTGCKRHPLLNT
jgi:hypothetical protein